LSRRTTTNRTSRLERRAEREARDISSAPTARRQRTEHQGGGGGGRGISTTTIAAVLGGLVIVAVIAYAVLQTGNTGDGVPDWQEAQLDDDPNIPGQYIPPHPGFDGQPDTRDDRQHFNPGQVVPICTQEQIDSGQVGDPLCYTSNPPTSGPHSITPQGFTNLENPAPKENIIHSMEHGGVFIWYNTSDQAAIDLVKDVVNENTDRRRFVGSTIYTEMEPETIAITSWTRLDKFPVSELTRERLQSFIDENHKRFNPEGF
jgi:uncharacterized protein DUF3105